MLHAISLDSLQVNISTNTVVVLGIMAAEEIQTVMKNHIEFLQA